jgi:hypothetical protein
MNPGIPDHGIPVFLKSGSGIYMGKRHILMKKQDEDTGHACWRYGRRV